MIVGNEHSRHGIILLFVGKVSTGAIVRFYFGASQGRSAFQSVVFVLQIAPRLVRRNNPASFAGLIRLQLLLFAQLNFIMEHRWGHRSSIDAPLRVLSAISGERQARLCNLSVSGALITAPFELNLLTPVTVIIARTRAPLDAYVTRFGPDGIGLEWYEFSPAAVVELLNLSAQYRRSLPRSYGKQVRESLATEPGHWRRVG
jgi:hypothetical protein